MKLLVTLAALSCALLGSAAPASGRWQPQPVDFELAPKVGASAPAAGAAVVSRPLRASGRFNLVGMRWSGRAQPRIAVRVRTRERRWSRWIRLGAHAEHNPDRGGEPAVAASDPLWVGEADRLQLHLSRRVPGLRLHFVNVRGTATASDRARTAIRAAAEGAVEAVAGRAQQAQGEQPAIVSREEWGAGKCLPRRRPARGVVKAVHVHHTVSLNDYRPAEAPAVVLAICRYHRNSNGWDDIGYHALVDRYGVLYEGRAGGLDQPLVGAQAQGYNAQTASIASIGDHRVVEQSAVALEAMARYIRWKLQVHGQPTSGRVTLVSTGGSLNRFPAGRRVRVERVLGHRDSGRTACPGDALYAQLAELRALVGAGLPAPEPGFPPAGAPTILSAALTTPTTLYRRPVGLGGTLLSGTGGPAAGQLVVVEALAGRRWTALDELTTDAAGAWSTVVSPTSTTVVRARFAGDELLAASTSPRLLLNVRPLLRLSPSPARAVRGRPVAVRGRVSPAKPLVYQVLQQRIGGRYRRVGVRAVPVRDGRFRGSFTPSFTGLYRVYVTTRADTLTDRGRSALRVVRVRRGGR